MNVFSLLSNAALASRLFRMFLLIPNLYPVIDKAERKFREPKSGAIKKQFVEASVKLVLAELQKRGYVTDEMTDGIEKSTSELIDILVTVNNTMKGFNVGPVAQPAD